MIENRQAVIIRTAEELEALRLRLADADIVAYDTETDGTDGDAIVIGFSVAWELEPAVGYYVILAHWDVARKKLVSRGLDPRPVLEALKTKRLVMQNGPFDCYMTWRNFGINFIPALHTDTLMLGHLLNENRLNGLKERGVELFGLDAKAEQEEMKASVLANGGLLTKKQFELYKADAEVIAKYGAQDAILTLQVFYHDLPLLFEEELDAFFYDDETMPLLRGPTYDLNTVGLRVDPAKLQKLRQELEAENLDHKAYIEKEVAQHVKAKYPGTSKKNIFNINSCVQVAWLLFFQLGQPFNVLTKSGRELCKALGMRLPYSHKAKREFLEKVTEMKGKVWKPAAWDWKKKRMTKPSLVKEPWHYLSCGKESLTKCGERYKWAQRLLEYKKNDKLLGTYVIGIQERMKYNVIHPGFLQAGTTSGRYSSRGPNFQNLPRDDKRIKACVVARQGKVFVGADFEQLEPRIFASQSKDARLLACFASGDDFYSTIGAPVFGMQGLALQKDAPGGFAKRYPALRQIAKVIALSATYGTTAPKMSLLIGKDIDETQEVIDNYFEEFPNVKAFQLESHEMAKRDGKVYNYFGRPRRISKAMDIPRIYGRNTPHEDLPYEARNLLNLAVNHRVQSTAASVMNRAAIACHKKIQGFVSENSLWAEVKIVIQVHDELVLEGPEALKGQMINVLRDAMENTCTLPGVRFIAKPKAAYNLADLK